VFFDVSRGNPALALEAQESVLDEMPSLIEIFIVGMLHGAIFLWRDYGFYTLIFSWLSARNFV
jgi:hypothetical protein